MASHTLQAIAVMVGTIIGVGIFALPFAFAQAGFFVGLGFLVGLSIVLFGYHLVYGEITLRTRARLHLVGYAERYFGQWTKHILTAAVLFGLVGGQLAYIIISGQFLGTVAESLFQTSVLSSFWWSVLFFVGAASIVYFGIRRVARGEVIMTGLLLVLVVLIAVQGARFVDGAHFSGLNPSAFFLPYGVVLFAMLGTAAIPEMREIMTEEGAGRFLYRAIAWGTFVPLVVYVLFAAIVVGITGGTTTQEPFQGLMQVLGARVIVLGSLFGFLAVITSYWISALNGMETLIESYDVPRFAAWIMIVGVPFGLFLLGVRDFVGIVEIVGVVVTAVIGTIMVLLWWRARREGDREPEYAVPFPHFIGASLIALFIGALLLRFIVF